MLWGCVLLGLLEPAPPRILLKPTVMLDAVLFLSSALLRLRL